MKANVYIRTFCATFLTVLLIAVLSSCRLTVENPYDTTVTSTKGVLSTTGICYGDLPDTPAVTSVTTSPTTEQLPLLTTSASIETLPETKPMPLPEPADTDLVLLADYLPEAILDIRYATTNNFTGQIIYEDLAPRLRYGTVKKLRAVCERLEDEGYRLVIWDGWRPAEAQWKLWNICPDPTYVSNPNKGYSSHTRGGTVDITLVRIDGSNVEMPTDFDDFSKAADLDFSDVSAEAAKNAQLLQDIMKQCGFKPYKAEWWHFTDNTTYEVMESLPE